MIKFQQLIIAAGALSATILAACGDKKGDEPAPADSGVTFVPTLQETTRATETAFEQGDAISVFAVESSNGIPGYLMTSGNYADNVKYVYNGTRFTAESMAIEKEEDKQLTYYAVYPYNAAVRSSFYFTVAEDQSTAAGFTASDLCTATSGSVSTSTVDLPFKHRYALMEVDLEAITGGGNAEIVLKNIYLRGRCNLNNNTFTSYSTIGTIRMYHYSGNLYRAIVPPQFISAGTAIGEITIGGVTYPWNLSESVNMKSGSGYGFSLYIENGSVEVEFTGDIDPWQPYN